MASTGSEYADEDEIMEMLWKRGLLHLAQVSINELICRELLRLGNCQGWGLKDRLFSHEVAVSRARFEGRERRFRA